MKELFFHLKNNLTTCFDFASRSSITDKRREVRRRDHRQLPRQASPSHCDGHRDGGERYGVRGDVWGLDDDVSWARDVFV